MAIPDPVCRRHPHRGRQLGRRADIACVALGRRNFLFPGADGGGERAASLCGLIRTAKLNGIAPAAGCARCASRLYRSDASYSGVALYFFLSGLSDFDFATAVGFAADFAAGFTADFTVAFVFGNFFGVPLSFKTLANCSQVNVTQFTDLPAGHHSTDPLLKTNSPSFPPPLPATTIVLSTLLMSTSCPSFNLRSAIPNPQLLERTT